MKRQEIILGKLLSVIVPCYNSERYIRRCVESILKQTYSSLEVIIVNDGSTDKSEELIKSINDSRIKYIYQDNSGVSIARNKGIESSEGDYITFVDSDDTIEPNMYEVLFELIHKYDVDIAHCSYSKVVDGEIKKIGNSEKIYNMDRDEAVAKLLSGELFVGSNWNKIYKSELFENIRFDSKIKINEDVLTNFLLFIKANKSVFIDKCLYNYYAYSNSSCNNINRIKSAEDCHKVSSLILEKSTNEKFEVYAYQRYSNTLSNLYRNYRFYGNKKQKDECKALRKEIISLLDNNMLSGNIKVNALILKYVSFLYGALYKIYDKLRTPNWDI